MSEKIPEKILDHLDEALGADDTGQKDFHIRQAEQLTVRLKEDS